MDMSVLGRLGRRRPVRLAERSSDNERENKRRVGVDLW